MNIGGDPLVSIILRSYNEAWALGETLAVLTIQPCLGFELTQRVLHGRFGSLTLGQCRGQATVLTIAREHRQVDADLQAHHLGECRPIRVTQLDPPVGRVVCLGQIGGRLCRRDLHAQAAPKREDIHTWFDLLDVDDFGSYGGQV